MKPTSSPLLALALSCTLALVGCATQPMGPTVLVMPAPTKPFEVFQQDQAMCMQYAQSMVGGQAHAANDRAVGSAAVGAVLGGVLGNQIGKGSGRTAATVLGAVGGGYVGHKVEERTRTTTVYQMRVRMQDGSVRSFTRSQPVAEGTPVRVQGKGFRVDDGSGDADRAGTQPVRVVDRGY